MKQHLERYYSFGWHLAGTELRNEEDFAFL
jgi:hypothetical protein